MAELKSLLKMSPDRVRRDRSDSLCFLEIVVAKTEWFVRFRPGVSFFLHCFCGSTFIFKMQQGWKFFCEK